MKLLVLRGAGIVGVIQPLHQRELSVAHPPLLLQKLEMVNAGPVKPHQPSVHLEGGQDLKGHVSVGLLLE